MPGQEGVGSPDLAALVLGVGQHGDELVLVEVLRRHIAHETLAHLGGKRRVLEPLGNRHGEALLRAVGPGVGQGLVGGGAQHGLRVAAQLVAVGVNRETAERDACRIEHAISEEAFQKLKASVEKQGNDTA